MDEEREVPNTLQLFPGTTDYRALIVQNGASVRAEYSRIYGHPTTAPAM